jgi:hypothetical protein
MWVSPNCHGLDHHPGAKLWKARSDVTCRCGKMKFKSHPNEFWAGSPDEPRCGFGWASLCLCRAVMKNGVRSVCLWIRPHR